MGKTIQIRVDKSLQKTLENIRIKVSKEMKKKYNLNEFLVPGTLASQILAAKHNGIKVLNFEIEKKGLNKGFIKLI